MEGGWVGGIGWGNIVLWRSHDVIGCAEEGANIVLEEDIFLPEEC